MPSEATLFSGDHVMGWSTSVIAPPGGNLNAFMASLEKLRGFDYERMVPAHGLPIEKPLDRINEIPGKGIRNVVKRLQRASVINEVGEIGVNPLRVDPIERPISKLDVVERTVYLKVVDRNGCIAIDDHVGGVGAGNGENEPR